MSIFASGPKFYQTDNNGEDNFTAYDDLYSYELDCRIRRSCRITIECHSSNSKMSILVMIRRRENDMADNFDQIYWKLDRVTDEPSSHVDLSSELAAISKIMSLEVNPNRVDHWPNEIELESLKLIRMLSGHKGFWLVDFTGPVEITCYCPTCENKSIWLGRDLPSPLKSMAISLSYPELVGENTIFVPESKILPISEYDQIGLPQIKKSMDRLRSLGIDDFREIEEFSCAMRANQVDQL